MKNLKETLKDCDLVFCKVLTKNDDSGRHGVLIPVSAYSMFPNFPDFDPLAKVNYATSITTIWAVGETKRESYWRHYHRYPERRMTSLSPELLNGHGEGALFVVAKLKGSFEYKCLVFESTHPNYQNVGLAFKLSENDELFEGSAYMTVSDLFTQDEEAIAELIEKTLALKEKGFIKTLKAGDTGVGFTFESLLGIAANSSQEPDYKGIEIKCSRSKQPKEKRKATSGKQTLFTLIPNWGDLENRRNLVAIYGIMDPVRKRKGLYCTIKIEPNSYGFYLVVNRTAEKISVMQHGKEVVSYEFNRLRNSLEQKHQETVFITAHAKKNENKEEEFLYDSLIHCKEVSFESFLKLVEENLLGVDFAIHTKDGKTRDHGFLWRLENKKYIYRLFNYVVERI